MPLLQEDMDIIKSKFEEWLAELAPELKPGVYDLELRNRMLKVEEVAVHHPLLLIYKLPSYSLPVPLRSCLGS
ncbi:MAG: hypothetical protein V2J08_05680 [Desulfotignum sp.]|jgi:hypothetical protein|nr:hypothetical protein [Desulfotignum sp.]